MIARPIAVTRRADNAANTTDNTADSAANNRANRTADRASRTSAVIRAALRAADNTLRLNGERSAGDCAGDNECFDPHVGSPLRIASENTLRGSRFRQLRPRATCVVAFGTGG